MTYDRDRILGKLEEIIERAVGGKTYYRYIGTDKSGWKRTYTMMEDDFDWIVEQIYILLALDMASEHELNHVDAEKKKYREALEFYADKRNWNENATAKGPYGETLDFGYTAIQIDEGMEAIMALGRDSDE